MARKRTVVEAEEFHVIDADKNVRAVLAASPVDGQPELRMLDGKSIPRISIGIESDAIHIALLYESGQSGVCMDMRDNGSLGIAVSRRDGTHAVTISVDGDGEPRIFQDGPSS